MQRGFFLATGLLAGTIVGAGIFSLPYVASEIGTLTGVLFLVSFAALYCIVHLMYTKLLLESPGKHEFAYLAERHLAHPFGRIAAFMILAELLFVLTVYLVLAPSFAELVVPGSGTLALLLFWVLGSLFIFAKLEWLGWTEFAGIAGVALIIIFVIFAGDARPVTTPLFRPLTLAAFLLPFGPLLFSFSGRPALHKVVEEYRASVASGAPFSLMRSVVLGTVIPAIVYAAFVFGILRLPGVVSPDALTGITGISPLLLGLVGVLGLITLWTSYFMIGANVHDMLRFDLHLHPALAAAAVVLVPVALFFVGFREFLPVLSFTGGVFLAFEGIFTIAMWRKVASRGALRTASVALYLVFLVALGYAIVDVAV